MPTTEQRDKYDADKIKSDNERKQIQRILWLVFFFLSCILLVLLIWR